MKMYMIEWQTGHKYLPYHQNTALFSTKAQAIKWLTSNVGVTMVYINGNTRYLPHEEYKRVSSVDKQEQVVEYYDIVEYTVEDSVDV